jgi:hypothetical protein
MYLFKNQFSYKKMDFIFYKEILRFDPSYSFKRSIINEALRVSVEHLIPL